MTPPGSGDGRPPRRLSLVQPADGNAARAVTPSDPALASSPPPASVRTTEPPLPPRSADLGALSRLIAGHTASLSTYQQMLGYLTELANPTATRGYDVTLTIEPNQYQIRQAGEGEAIEVTVTQRTRAATSTQANQAQAVIQMTYMPDGTFRSSQSQTPHNAPRRGAESFFHQALNHRLAEHASRMFQGGQLFTRIENSLQALEGRFAPENQAIWHDHLVTHNGRVYSFRRMSFMGMEALDNPQHNQIAIFEETGTQQVRVATVSANGEVDYAPGRGGRDPANVQLLDLLNQVAPRLEEAKTDPIAYQARLRQTLGAMPAFQRIQPTVRYSIDIPRDLSLGNTPRGHVQDFRRGWELFRSLRSSRSWSNPMNPAESGTLRPPWRLSRAMTGEMLSWAKNTAGWFLLESFRNPRPAGDSLRLQLFPEGGGQLSIYRNQALHNIVTAGPEGPAWYADQEIRQMQRDGLTFPSRFHALQAAVARRAQAGQTTTSAESIYRSPHFNIRVQEAPAINFNILHQGDNGTVPIRSVSEAWTQLQRQIPEGVEPRVDTRFENSIVGSIFATSGEPNRIIVDFHQSQPAMQIDMRQQKIQLGDSEVPRVEIFVRHGENTYARVFENGVFREDLARDVHQASLRQAQEGAMHRSIWARMGQGGLRAFSHIRASGFTYGFSHFASLPFILGAEQFMLNPTERRLIGTPGLEANLHPSYIFSHVVTPFGAQAFGSGLGTIAVDGVYNASGGIARTLATYRGTEATLSQAWRLARPSFYNASPFARPVAPSMFRGFLQRSVPLFGGLVFMDRLQSGQWFSPNFSRQLVNVGAVSLGSAALLRGIQASSSLSGAFVRRGLMAETAAAGGARFGLTFRGGVALAVLEMTVLGILDARQRREQLQLTGRALRSDLGQAIDRRNELITRLEAGEEVQPRHLFAADAHVQEAQATYRRFLELTERNSGNGSFRELTLNNDFASEENRYQNLRAGAANDPVALTQLESEHRRRVTELESRYQRMEVELDQLYAHYGTARTTGGPESGEDLRSFLTRQSEALSANPDLAHSASAAAEPPPRVESPITVESGDGRLIVDHMRWLASQEPGSILWSRERKADYILREFRGYQITQSDGTQRPWTQAEAIAFLDAVDVVNIRRVRNLEAPLSLPSESDHLPTENLQALLNSEQSIRAREAASHAHVSAHTDALADNVQDLDSQMAAYYRVSNERSAIALARFLPPESTVAMAH